MRRCCVPGCYSNFTKPYVSVFTFPKDPELCKLWLKNIGRPTMKVHENIGVCIKHFDKHSIIGIDSNSLSRKKLSVKYGSVPTVFEDECSSDGNARMKKKMQSVDNFARMQRKGTKSPISSVSDSPDKSSKYDDDEQRGTIKSPKKVSPTTDRPIIAVIKAEDLIMEEEKSPEKMDENNDYVEEQSTPRPKPFSLPSPFKNLPNVSVCLKEEDRVPFIRELKGVKRSPSTGSNSSTGSIDAQKSAAFMTKRRKIEKPAPVVIGRQNDCYCWMCHRENVSLCCIACPRGYHFKCAAEMSAITSDWVCPECQRLLAAENVDTRSSTLAEISLDKLGALLRLSLNKMKQRAPIAFHQPVSLEHYPRYLHYVIHPMDFTLLEKNIKQKVYGCTEAFLADVKWIYHNSCVFNGTQHPLSTNAKNLVKSCDQDMQEIEVCPDCFVHSVVRNKYWFSEVCRKPHPLVWAKLKGFPYWPAKVVRILDGNVDARFFGAHDRAWVPVSQCYHLSKEMPTTSKPKKKGNYEVALYELNVYVHLFIQKFGSFEYAPYRTNFDPENKTLMYHGIDIDKAAKEDISIDNSSVQDNPNVPLPEIMKLDNSEKENRFESFLESESEKSSTDETKLSGSQNEIQFNASLSKEGVKSPSFFFNQRKSTDSVISDQEISAGDSKTIDEPKNADEAAKSNSAQNSSEKRSDKTPDSDQLRKLELALERIKGYVSLNVESEKENNEIENEEDENEEEKLEKNSSEERKKEETEKFKVSPPVFKETVTLPIIESSSVQEEVEDVSVVLEATKKTDSFFLKLNETIASCKAKLGISDITDDLSSDESAGDNASRSDEDEDDDSSASDIEEASEEDVGEEDAAEVSDEDSEGKLDDGESEDEESDEDQDSESSTDIECTNEMSPKKTEKSVIEENGTKELTIEDSEVSLANEDNVKELTNYGNEAIITNPDVLVPEVTIEDSGALETAGESSLSQSSNEVKADSESSPNEQTNEVKGSKALISQEVNDGSGCRVQSNSLSEDSKNESLNVNSIEMGNKHISSVNFSVNKNLSPLKTVQKNLAPLNNSTSSNVSLNKISDDIKNDTSQKVLAESTQNAPDVPCKTEADDDDDEIFICTPTRPKSPPVIVLDDDQENENSSASDTFAVKSPPYSTSIESFSNDENPTCRTNSGDDHDNPHGKPVSVNGVSSEKLQDEQNLSSNETHVNNKNATSDSRNSAERRKRKSSSDSSSDDEIQIVTPMKKPALTGAIRTFNKPNNSVPTLKPVTPTMETVKRNLEKESLNQVNQSPMSTESGDIEGNSPEDQVMNDPVTTPVTTPNSGVTLPQNSENLLKSPVIDTSNLSDKDKEILFLKSKLNCVLTAYQIQSWKCSQERDELRHNMNLIIMEMRTCLESDKKQAIEALTRKFEEEKQKCVEEIKRKQWCANCLMESRYACCWNTNYCSIDCQKRHFPEHRSSCTQLKNKNLEVEGKQRSNENNENKKVIILNMKSSDTTQQVSVNKSQIQIMPKNVPLQIASTSNSNSNIQFVLAPVKSSTESAVITSAPSVTSSKEHGLDSAQIISQVRNKACDLGTAISLLKKKNLESTLTFVSKKEEKQQVAEKPKEETNLEEIYFPSPPRVTFENYDTTSPDPNVVILENEETKDDCDTDVDLDLPSDVTPEQDMVLSDSEDVDNEMVHIGRGIDVKAKFLNKCLVYGKTAKKLTRCLVDVIFPDVKLLATCSAFGQKSNVTKLTRAALPTRKVHSIIDFVMKRFPDSSRSEIVLAINMKCKEARVIVNRKESDLPKKTMVRRLLAREKEDELATVITSTLSPVVTSSVITSSNKIVPNVVCVKSTNQTVMPFSVPVKSSGTNILRCNTQRLLRPKTMLNTVGNTGNTGILETSQPKKRETVKNLLAANKRNLPMGNLSKDGTKLVMSLDTLRPSTSSTQPVTPSCTTTTSMRPYIIIGSQMNSVRPSSSMQIPALPASQINK